MKTLIKNGKYVDTLTKEIKQADILIKDGIIASIKKDISEENRKGG